MKSIPATLDANDPVDEELFKALMDVIANHVMNQGSKISNESVLSIAEALCATLHVVTDTDSRNELVCFMRLTINSVFDDLLLGVYEDNTNASSDAI